MGQGATGWARIGDLTEGVKPKCSFTKDTGRPQRRNKLAGIDSQGTWRWPVSAMFDWTTRTKGDAHPTCAMQDRVEHQDLADKFAQSSFKQCSKVVIRGHPRLHGK